MMRVIGGDDPRHQGMADDIVGGELGEGDALHADQNLHRVKEAGALAGGEIDLARVASDHHARALAHAGQEHFHLHRRRVLGLVEDDEGMGEGAPAHEGERGDLDLAAGQASRHLLGRHHVVERVIERAEIGIDLLLEIAGQEAEPLAGLDGGAREHDAVDTAGLQHRHRLRHREIGFAGAGWADREHRFRAGEEFDIAQLPGAQRRDGAAAGADRRQIGERQAGGGLGRGEADGGVDLRGAETNPTCS